MKTAVAAIFAGVNQPFVLRQYPVKNPAAGQVAMELIASGICGTDLHIYSGRLGTPAGTIIGHEFIGRVTAIGEGVTNVSVGDTVISDIACPCGKCLLCRTGDDANCVAMGVTNGGDPEQEPHFWGGYGEMSYAPAENLIRIPTGVDPRIAAVYACAGPTCMHAFRLGAQAGLELAKVNYAVVQGAGAVGCFAVTYLKAMGVAKVVLVTGHKNEQKEKTALAAGADEVLALDGVSAQQLTEKVLAETDGLGADLVIEASGGAAAVPLGLQLLRNRGVYLIPGQYSNRGDVAISPQLITFKALQLIGSSQYSVCDVQDYLAFLVQHSALHKNIAATACVYPVAQVNKAYEDLQAGKVTKALLVPNNG